MIDEYEFSVSTLELISGRYTTYNAGDVWKTKDQEEIQILWMRKGSKFPVYTTESKFLKLSDLTDLVSRVLEIKK